MTSLSLVGSTGSIGTQTLDVVRAERDRYEVVALGAARSVDLLAEQAREFHPATVAIADEALAPALKEQVPDGTEVLAGAEALATIARTGDVVVNACVGFAGLPVTLAALSSGRRLALANKESLIAGGPVVQRVRGTPGAELLPVDSEHCALHQCLQAGPRDRVRRLVVTASGGPFRGRSRADLTGVTVDEALAHPTWNMGPMNTINSSTLFNKGLEVLEAHELFGVGFDDIDVVVHPQSVVHSIVEFTDGASIAQLSLPDMRLCIGYALAWPDRAAVPFGAIDWSDLRLLEFEEPDLDAFPALRLAYEAGRMGGTAPAAVNAANEVAVESFLQGLIPWVAISEVLEDVLDSHDGTQPTGTLLDGVDVVLEADRVARERARRAVERRAPTS